MITELLASAQRIAALLKARGETIAVAESSTAGLVCAALLAVPGASAYFEGGAVVYTRGSRRAFLAIPEEALAGIRPATEAYALLFARAARTQLGTVWGLGETGSAGPTGNRYGDPAGHSAIAVSGPVEKSLTIETGKSDRLENMRAFAAALLDLLEQSLGAR